MRDWSLGGSARRRLCLSRAAAVVVAALAFTSSLVGVRAEERVTKYFVQVHAASVDEARHALESAGFDVAGVNGPASTVGIVATAKELDRLDLLGYRYAVESSNESPLGIQALQDYTDPQEFSTFLDQVVAAYPTLAQKTTLAGPFFEGRYQYVLRITKDVSLPNERPAFIIDAQHHAREVMTPEILRDMVDYLTSRYATDTQVQRWVDNINIYVVGSANPDGAMYVFTGDNMWRKNRRPSCPVDVNRNYPFLWGGCNGSSNVCSDETNRGSEPASEPETQGMLQLVASVHAFFQLSYHSYGEYMLWNYGCSNPDEAAAMNDVGQALNNMLQNDSGTTPFAVPSRTGPIWSAIYQVDGGSVDSSYGLYGTYGYSIEVNSTGFQPDYATWRNVTVQRQRTAWQFFLDRTLDGPQIRGKVTNAVTGQPLAARISVQEVTFTHGESQRRADSNGRYHWLARSGQTYHVTFELPGYCTITRSVAVGSGPATLDVGLVPPTPPTGVSAVGAGDNAIDVSWSPAIDAVEYRVLRSLTSGGPYTQVGTVTAPQTTFHDATVSGNATYSYVVRAMQPCDSGNSAEASASTTGICFVGPAFFGVASVTNPQATTCSIDLGWSPATARCGGRLTYQVYRSTTTPFTPSAASLVAAGLEGTGFTDHGALAEGVTYHYIVRAMDSASGADDGNTVTVGAAPTGPFSTGTWTDDAGDTGQARLTPTSPWSVLATGGKTGPRVYATGNYTNNLCAPLTTPPITVQAGAVLSFASKYDIEKDWDAGIVEVAEGPAYSTWSRLATVNYPDALLNTGNACGFPMSFAGTVFSRLYSTPTYPGTNYSGSLAAYAGKTIKLRWRISSDSTGTAKGWWVDDIAVTNAEFQQACVPGTAANPKEAGYDASPMTASRTPEGTAVDLSYGPACGALDNAVFWGTGPIAGSVAWSNAACGVGNTGEASFDPGEPAPGSFFYFVIVGQTGAREGSYGQGVTATLPVERPEAVGVGGCDRPQDLSGTCP